VSTASRPASIQFDRDSAALRHADGQRVAALSLDTIHALHLALIEQLGENAADVLYRSGYEWALQDMVRFNRQLRQKLGDDADLGQMDARFILDSWWAPFAEAGWGTCTFDPVALARGIMLVELRGSAVAPGFAGSDQPACHLYAGLFAGAFSYFERTERHAAEMHCTACGAATCTFLVGPGAEVDSAETQRQHGAAPAEILRQFR